MTNPEWDEELASTLTDSGWIVRSSGCALDGTICFAHLIRNGVSKDVRLSCLTFAGREARMEEILRQMAGLLSPHTGISYHVEGAILVLTFGLSTFEDRLAVYARARADPSVPEAAPLLLDVRPYPGPYSEALLRERIPVFWQQLGPKAGTTCAVVLTEEQGLNGHLFQATAAEREVRVGLFREAADARRWLQASLPSATA